MLRVTYLKLHTFPVNESQLVAVLNFFLICRESAYMVGQNLSYPSLP